MVDCQQAKCSEKAEWLVHWPGQPIKVCESCSQVAGKLALVMGFSLPREPLMAQIVRNLTEEQKADIAAYILEHDDEV